MKTVALTLAAFSLLACTRSKPVDEKSLAVTEVTPSARAAMDDQDRAGTTTLTSASWVPNDSAMDRLAIARCARESACAAAAPTSASADKIAPQSCVPEMKTRTWSSLRADVCPSGVRGNALEECIQAIQHESCNSPLGTLSRLTACRASELCGN